MIFENLQNGYKVETSVCGLWTLLFGPFYFMKHGVWSHVVISFFTAVFTFGAAWLIYPFFSGGIIRNHYLKQGWKQIQD